MAVAAVPMGEFRGVVSVTVAYFGVFCEKTPASPLLSSYAALQLSASALFYK